MVMFELLLKNQLSAPKKLKFKKEILARVQGRNSEDLNAEINFYKTELLPYFIKLSQHNPVFSVTEQLRLLVGVWTPIWSTISFHESLPKRIQDQSFQIFQHDGYCGSVARYVMGKEPSLSQNYQSNLPAYDFMLIQKYGVQNGKWYLQNIDRFQAFQNREIPLNLESVYNWFTNVVNTKVKLNSPKFDLPKALELKNIDTNDAQELQKTSLASSQIFEHLYIDNDWRLVKTQTDASHLPSYTIAVKRQ
ncbi:MAG: hypothetical protein RMX25_009835 [Nostoc sp. DedVER01b]|uniref:hypothetical protein n=2 Tax=unclassified Nostoc TaxID=2593658 RepID=UPI002AD3F913|nr:MULTISPECIES: hypothetical protein [unclassified Nostoc]MDZ7988322.1 hypothetical protein [Nostoc sp. DedVER02]MDZ8113618.1 hypothetical protein [Nostoc sp. DedVER01b]